MLEVGGGNLKERFQMKNLLPNQLSQFWTSWEWKQTNLETIGSGFSCSVTMQAPIIDCNIQKINIQCQHKWSAFLESNIDWQTETVINTNWKQSQSSRRFRIILFWWFEGFADLFPWTFGIANYLYSRNCGITTFPACKHEAFTALRMKENLYLNWMNMIRIFAVQRSRERIESNA